MFTIIEFENISTVVGQNAPSFTKVIDGKTYQVGIYFAKTGATFQDKYERMLRQELLVKNHTLPTATDCSDHAGA